MDNTALASAIIARLAQYLPFVAVEDFPDDVNSYYLTHPKGALLVMYSASAGDGMKRERAFEVVAVSRGLQMACKMIEAARWILERWEPFTGATKFICEGDQFLQEDSGTWWYGSRFTLTGPPPVVKEADLQSRINQYFNIS